MCIQERESQSVAHLLAHSRGHELKVRNDAANGVEHLIRFSHLLLCVLGEDFKLLRKRIRLSYTLLLQPASPSRRARAQHSRHNTAHTDINADNHH
jgi:hypothetical protein